MTMSEREQELAEREEEHRECIEKATQKLRQEALKAKAESEKLKKEKRDCELAVARQNQAEEQLAEACRKIEEQQDYICELEKWKEQAKLLLQDFFAKNENLLRMNRERSNAARGLQPKKERSGYVLLSSKHRESRVGAFNFSVWETQLQTPYEAIVPYDTAVPFMENELAELVLNRLNLSRTEQMLTASLAREAANSVYRIDYAADYRAGYWNILLYHTRPLGDIPVDLIGK